MTGSAVKYFLVLAVILAGQTYSQKIGASYVKFYTDNYELQYPQGFGLKASYPLSSKVDIAVEYLNVKNTREYIGYLVSGFMIYPPIVYPHHIKSSSSAESFEFTLLYRLFRYHFADMSVGGGLTTTKYKAKREDQETNESYTFEESRIGYTAGLTIATNPQLLKNISFNVSGRIRLSPSSQEVLDAEMPFSSIYATVFSAGVMLVWN
jgi:hypothetical protein